MDRIGNLHNARSQRKWMTQVTEQMAGTASEAASVTDYGAVGDGVADDSPAFQDFLDASASAGGLRLAIPAGNYRLATPLTYPATANGFVFAGDNQNTSKLIVDTGSWLMDLNVTDSRSGFGFHDLTILCNSGSNGLAFGNTTATLFNFLLLIERCIIQGSGTRLTEEVFNDTTGVITRTGQTGVSLKRMFRSKITDCLITQLDYGVDLFECDHPVIAANFLNCLTAIRARTPSGSTYSIQHVVSGSQIEGGFLTGFAGANCSIAIGDGTRMEMQGGTGTGVWDLTSKLGITAACTEVGTTWTLSSAIDPLVLPLGECVLEMVEAAAPNRIERVIPISYDGAVTVGVVSTFSNNPPRYEVPWTSSGCTIRRVTGNTILSNSCGGAVAQCALAPLVNEGYSIFHVVSRGTLTASDLQGVQPVGIQGNFSAPEQQIGDGTLVLHNVPRAMMPVNEHPFVVVKGHSLRATSTYRWGQVENGTAVQKLVQQFDFSPGNYGYWASSTLFRTNKIREYIDDVISRRPVWVWQTTSNGSTIFALPWMPSILRWAGIRITVWCRATSASSKTIRILPWNETDGDDTAINLVTGSTTTAWQKLVWISTALPSRWSSVNRAAGQAAGVKVNATVSDLMIQAVRIEELSEVSIATLTYVLDGAGGVVPTGISGDLEVPFECQIVGWTMLETTATSGSMVVDIWKDSFANFPPLVADTITAADKPTITSSTKGQGTALTGWSPQLRRGDILRFNVDSVTACKRVTISLQVAR